jgi:hypothetical protein
MNCVKRAAVLISGTFFFASTLGYAQQKKLFPKPTAASFQKSDKASLEKRRLPPQIAVSKEKTVPFNSKGLLLKKPVPVSNSIFSTPSPVEMSCEETHAPFSAEKGPALKECNTVKLSAVYEIE